MKKFLILSVVCLLAAVQTTTTASAQYRNYRPYVPGMTSNTSTTTTTQPRERLPEPDYHTIFVSAEADGVWVKNHLGFSPKIPILKIRMKNDGNKANWLLNEVQFNDSINQRFKSHKANMTKYTFDKIKYKNMPVDDEGWHVVTLEKPIYFEFCNTDSVCLKNIQFFIDDTKYKEQAVRRYASVGTLEQLLNAAAFCEDGDASHIGNPKNVKYSSRPMPKLAAEYKKKAADKQAEIEKKKQEEEQKRLAAEKRRQEDAERAAKMEQEKEAFKKKYGVTNDEKGKYVMDIYESAVQNGTEASYAALGRAIAIGYGIKNKNYKDAIEYMNIALNTQKHYEGFGDDYAKYFLADMYWNGWGVAQDRHKAIEYYTESIIAIQSINTMYYRANGYDEDFYASSFHKSVLRMGNYYETGQTRNGSKEIDSAIYWYAYGVDRNKSHADVNYGEMAYRLGRYYETARVGATWGIPDLKTARYLYHLAYNNGNAQTKAKAKQALDRIGH